jgi:sigma-54 dependent transcriptional regulator, acetoin dehydrogenase operon transcriptional activator AcoR
VFEGLEERVGDVVVEDMPRALMRGPGEHERRTRDAWERFAAGDDDVHGVPALILLSWQRSRDLYRVDPLEARPPRAGGAASTSLLHGSAVTQLGGVAAGIAASTEGSLTTVTDGAGRILGSWGTDDMRRRAEDVDLAPMFTWSEAATGTNGVGTALGRSRPVSVRGPEHWRASLHDWTCHGISISDAVTGDAVAVLNVSFWGTGHSPVSPDGLEQSVAPVRHLLRKQAFHDGKALVGAFTAAAARAGTNEAVLAADVGGNIVAANRHAHAIGGHLPLRPAPEPGRRRDFLSPQLREVARTTAAQVRLDPDWTATIQLGILHEDLAFAVRPVHHEGEFVGILLVSMDGSYDADVLDEPDPEAPAVPAVATAAPDQFLRIAGVHDSRLILLSPHEIRYAAADKHVVWLVTDRGRLRAADRGIDNIERELGPFGFLRVHRSYLVNVHRIREVDQGLGKGTITVSTQHHGCEAIPVSRRHAPRLRTALGI